MAEIAVSGLIKVTLERLSSPIMEQFWLFRGLREDIEKLRNTLSIIMALLSDVEKKQQGEWEERLYPKQLKEAAYDAADILDECETEALRRKLETERRVTKKIREFFSASNPVLFDLRVAHKVKEIRRRLDGIFLLRSNLVPSDLPVIETNAQEDTFSFIDESSVYGREEDKEKVVELLLNADNDKKVSVIPFVGMGGVGKTTLAKYVYNDERVQGHFDMEIWVCVSTNFDVRRLTKAILENATAEKFAHEDVDVIQRSLRQHLSGKKFLLVLDNAWDDNQDKWEQLKGFLQAGATGSKIIVTTRSQKVASVMGTLPSHILKRVSDDDCWSIFRQRAFAQGRQENQSLVDLGKEITKQCRGIPLTAKALGSLMYLKTEESQWQFVRAEIWKGLGHALRLSYYDLQPTLKKCFAYCSVFPKDHKIRKDELVSLWMAAGFLPPSQGTKLTDKEIGREYFDELMWRSFFQDAEKDNDGNVVSCKMHDLMHQLAESVSEDARSVVGEYGEIIVPEGCRHLSVEMRGFQQVSITSTPWMRKKKLRTLLLLGSGGGSLSHKFFTNLPCLRVLDLGGVELSKDVRNSIGGLKHLKYLCLSTFGMRILPNSLSKLHNLQTLKLMDSWVVNELPKDMREMISLRHLQIDEWRSLTHMPVKMGELRFLQTLPMFIVGENSGCNIRQLGNLKCLRGELNIRKLENVRDAGNAQEAQLSENVNLTSLGLSWSRIIANAAEMLDGLQPHQNLRCLRVENYGGERLPHWIACCYLPNLVELSLVNCRGLEQEQLPPLGRFPLLKFLYMSRFDGVKCIGSNFYGDSAFPSLEQLTIEEMPNLEEWSGWNGSRQAVLPCLKSLLVRGCPKLTSAKTPCFPLLSSLTLSGFEAESLPNYFFQNRLTHLSMLEIDSCQNLESMSRELGNFAATLEELHISNCPKLVSLFPEEMQNRAPCLRHLLINQCNGLTSLRLQGLASLTSLSIGSCKNLASFVGGMHHLTALQRLEITECPGLLGSLADGMEHLTSLTDLYIQGCFRLRDLPEGLKHATRLQYLFIGSLPTLEALPDWIGNLSSLEILSISGCPHLMSLPSVFGDLRNLQSLSIHNCPRLEEQLENREEDWHKISHIPRISITA